jgi:hypothetical protein
LRKCGCKLWDDRKNFDAGSLQLKVYYFAQIKKPKYFYLGFLNQKNFNLNSDGTDAV